MVVCSRVLDNDPGHTMRWVRHLRQVNVDIVRSKGIEASLRGAILPVREDVLKTTIVRQVTRVLLHPKIDGKLALCAVLDVGEPHVAPIRFAALEGLLKANVGHEFHRLGGPRVLAKWPGLCGVSGEGEEGHRERDGDRGVWGKDAPHRLGDALAIAGSVRADVHLRQEKERGERGLVRGRIRASETMESLPPAPW